MYKRQVLRYETLVENRSIAHTFVWTFMEVRLTFAAAAAVVTAVVAAVAAVPQEQRGSGGQRCQHERPPVDLEE